MKTLVFSEQSTYPIILLCKETAFNTHEVEGYYANPLEQAGIPKGDIAAVSLSYNTAGKAPVKHIKAYLEDLMPRLNDNGAEILYVADAAYFKQLTGNAKAEAFLGYEVPCIWSGCEHMKVILGINHKSLIYDPRNEEKLQRSLQALIGSASGNYTAPGQNIIEHAEYPLTVEEIRQALLKCFDKPYLAIDIEAASLRHNEAGIATITLCWSKHEGVAFPVDYVPYSQPTETGHYGYMKKNEPVRALLREFFDHYTGEARYHNATYDVKILIYELFMKGKGDDNEMLIQGIETMTRNFSDTKIITYLATNSCAGNKLGLKEQAREFAGNWAQEDIKDVLKIPLPDLLQYNLVDGLSTNFVYEKHWETMCNDNQLELYRSMMLPSLQTILQLELTGMPMDMAAVAAARKALEDILQECEETFYTFPVIHQLEASLQVKAMEEKNAKLKKKRHPLSAFSHIRFNPNSNPQVAKLLYGMLKLPIIDRTKAKEPAVGAKTLDKLLNHAQDQDTISLMETLIKHAKAAKVLSSFIPAFERSIKHAPDDIIHWLHGSFNLGGTKSGRLSSSDPNLQNIPSGSMYAKMVKKCFKPPEGWVMGGADFNSLEDYISALTTKDPNKLKVYIEGYDGHSLRAFSYWPDRFPFDELTPELSFAVKKDPILNAIRSKSKNPTFALTYQGTWITLVKNLGFPEAEAKAIEKNYHELYVVSDEYVQGRLDQASQDGYVDVAFGLRLRTPMLHKTVRHSTFTPYEAEAEGRTAGNALGQSYGLLNNRAFNEFMAKVWKSPYRNDIKPIALIHDAIYLLMRDNVEVVEWVNRELVKSMSWQELPELQHDIVKIGAELDLFWPTWANSVGLPVNASQEEIKAKCHQAVSDYEEKAKKVA